MEFEIALIEHDHGGFEVLIHQKAERHKPKHTEQRRGTKKASERFEILEFCKNSRFFSSHALTQISISGPVYFFPSNTSGAAYGGDPHHVSNNSSGW